MGVISKIAIAVAIMVAPTLGYIGLMRGLKRMRDDRLIARIEQQPGMEPLDEESPAAGSEGSTPFPGWPTDGEDDRDGEDSEFWF